MTINLTINDIPNYIKASKLYEILNENDNNDLFNIPNEFFKKELVINTFEDLISYIRIFDYWMINNIPNEFYDWIFENKDKINMDLLNELFNTNNLIKQLKIIIDTPSNNELCYYYSSIGNLELLKYIYENRDRYKWLVEKTCSSAAENGHLECLKYAHENGCMWDEYTCSSAAKNGHLDCLKYAHENGCPWHESTCCNANGHLDCLKYAHENGCPWNKWTCCYSAMYGHLECLKYAHENGCEWNHLICSYAATNGHLECLKYAHENDCPWIEDTCQYAAEYGQLECLKYAYENGCPWRNQCASMLQKMNS